MYAFMYIYMYYCTIILLYIYIHRYIVLAVFWSRKPRHALGSNSVTVVGIKGKKFGDRRGGKQIKHEVRKEERDAWRRSLFVQMPNNPGCGKQNKARICQRSIFKLRTCLVFFAVRKEEKGQVLGGRPASGKKKGRHE